MEEHCDHHRKFSETALDEIMTGITWSFAVPNLRSCTQSEVLPVCGDERGADQRITLVFVV